MASNATNDVPTDTESSAPPRSSSSSVPQPQQQQRLETPPTLTKDRFHAGNNVIAGELVTIAIVVDGMPTVLLVDAIAGFSVRRTTGKEARRPYTLHAHLVTAECGFDIGEWTKQEMPVVFATTMQAWTSGINGKHDPEAMAAGKPIKKPPSQAAIQAALNAAKDNTTPAAAAAAAPPPPPPQAPNPFDQEAPPSATA